MDVSLKMKFRRYFPECSKAKTSYRYLWWKGIKKGKMKNILPFYSFIQNLTKAVAQQFPVHYQRLELQQQDQHLEFAQALHFPWLYQLFCGCHLHGGYA